MTRVVRGADGRMWTIRSTASWREPATHDSVQFEHDVEGGRNGAVVLLVLVALFLVVVIAWTPSSVVAMPGYFILAVLAVLFLFPMRGQMRRPWTVLAESAGDYGMPPERWVGTVRGSTNARREVEATVRHLQTYAVPDDGKGPLRLVN